MSAMISIGRINPVESLAGNIDAAMRGTRIPMPGIPAFVKPIINAQKMKTNH